MPAHVGLRGLSVGRLDGKLALVTGSASGIGRAIAERFAVEGAAVAVADISGPDRAEETLRRVRAAGAEGVAVLGDVSNVDDARRIVDEASAGLGGLDIVVNNAGHFLPPAACRRLRRRLVRPHRRGEPARAVPDREVRDPAPPRAGRRRAARHRLRQRDRGVAWRLRVQRLEGGAPHAREDHRDRLRDPGHPLELHLPRGRSGRKASSSSSRPTTIPTGTCGIHGRAAPDGAHRASRRRLRASRSRSAPTKRPSSPERSSPSTAATWRCRWSATPPGTSCSSRSGSARRRSRTASTRCPTATAPDPSGPGCRRRSAR